MFKQSLLKTTTEKENQIRYFGEIELNRNEPWTKCTHFFTALTRLVFVPCVDSVAADVIARRVVRHRQRFLQRRLDDAEAARGAFALCSINVRSFISKQQNETTTTTTVDRSGIGDARRRATTRQHA